MNTTLAFEIVLKTVTLLFAIGLLGFGIMFLEQVDYVGRFIDTMNHKKSIVERQLNNGYRNLIISIECLWQRLFYHNRRFVSYPDMDMERFAHEYVIGSQKVVSTSVVVKPKSFNVTLHDFGTRVDARPNASEHIKPLAEEDVDTIIKRRFGFI